MDTRRKQSHKKPNPHTHTDKDRAKLVPMNTPQIEAPTMEYLAELTKDFDLGFPISGDKLAVELQYQSACHFPYLSLAFVTDPYC